MRFIVVVGLAFLLSTILLQQNEIVAGQIVAGTPEDKLFQEVAKANPEAKLEMLIDFENRFPQSKVLPHVYLMIIDVYRQRNDRAKIIEYGEKTLKADQNNVTAMMTLSRNYTLENKNLDRAVSLAEQAVNLIEKMKGQPAPAGLTDVQWRDYLKDTEAAARSILGYAKTVGTR